MAALQKIMVAQASRLCCEQTVFSRTGETPVPRLNRCHDFRVLKRLLDFCYFKWLKCYQDSKEIGNAENTIAPSRDRLLRLRLLMSYRQRYSVCGLPQRGPRRGKPPPKAESTNSGIIYLGRNKREEINHFLPFHNQKVRHPSSDGHFFRWRVCCAHAGSGDRLFGVGFG